MVDHVDNDGLQDDGYDVSVSSSSAAREKKSLVVGGRYVIKKKIGSGAFGDIYLAESSHSGSQVAVKLESVKAKFPQLAYEYKLYKLLQGGVGIPRVRWFGKEANYNVLVMDLLGPSLEDLFNFCGRKFSLKTVLMLADQLIGRIEYIHSKNYLHRDIKPDNFLMGLGNKSNLVYLIDYGLVKKYRDPKTHQHIPYSEGKNLTGTARYASVNTHLGIEQSRRDDLEALGFVLMYFLRGRLPWQGLKANSKKERYEKISQKKQSTPIEVLCKSYPAEFATYLNYCRSLRFDDKPDYAYLRRLFRDLFYREGFHPDFVYDWTILNYNSGAGRAVPPPADEPEENPEEEQEPQEAEHHEQEHEPEPEVEQPVASMRPAQPLPPALHAQPSYEEKKHSNGDKEDAEEFSPAVDSKAAAIDDKKQFAFAQNAKKRSTLPAVENPAPVRRSSIPTSPLSPASAARSSSRRSGYMESIEAATKMLSQLGPPNGSGKYASLSVEPNPPSRVNSSTGSPAAAFNRHPSTSTNASNRVTVE